jgi:hypothetical protein
MLDLWQFNEEQVWASYSGKNDQQWRVDFYPREKKLKPQICESRSHPEYHTIEQFSVSAPQKWKANKITGGKSDWIDTRRLDHQRVARPR